MQQRVGLARAFATNADILLMDEPFSALDPLIRDKLQDELLALQARVKKTILFVSHDLDEALRLGDRISIMRNGRIVQTGTAQDIVLRPADDYVAEFVRRMNPLKVLTGAMVMRARELLERGGRRAVPRRRAALSPQARRRRRARRSLHVDGAAHPLRAVDDDEACAEDERSRHRRAGLDHAAGTHSPAPPHGTPRAARRRRAGARRCGRNRDHRGAFARAAAQGRLHEDSIRAAGLSSCWRRPAWSARLPAPSRRRAAFDLQGHRGARGLAPENTLAGFTRALAIGVTTLELDCGVTQGRRRRREPRPRC